MMAASFAWRASESKQRRGSPSRARGSGVAVAVSPVIGFLIAWLFFFYLGQWLISIPTAFHEGKLP